MKERIYRSNVAVALASLLVFSLILSVGLYFVFAGRFQQHLSSEVRLLAAAMNRSDDPDAVFAGWAEDSGSRLTLIGADGAVLGDSVASAPTDNHFNRPEVAQALQDGFGTSRRQSATLDEMTFYAAQRLSDGRVLRLAGSQQSVFSVLMRAFLCFFLALPLTLAISSVLAGKTTRAILRPIDALDLDHPSDSEIYDEFTPLLSRLSAQNRRIESQMRELERRQREFAAITDKMSEGLIILNARGEILTLNSSARKIFRAGDADYAGQYVLLLHRSTELMNAIQRAREGESSSELMRLNGRVYQLIASPVVESGATQGILLLIPDVTDRAEAERGRREFSANVSHELKTPLTSILGYAELIQSGMAPEADSRRFAGQIYDAARRLLQLVEDIIHLSRLDEGAPARFESVDLARVAEAVCQRFQSQADAAGVSLKLSARPAAVDAVPHMADELLTNLVDNAIKYNRPGGDVTVEVSPEGHGARVRVRDTGIGIAQEHQDKIFERFYRVDKSHSREIGGTGLGLSIVKHIAAYHHAAIDIDSELGRGTVLTVSFPAHHDR